MTKIYYRGAEAAIVCYGTIQTPCTDIAQDLTDKNSFERARFWVDELLMNVENCRIYLVGTKGIPRRHAVSDAFSGFGR